MAERWDCVPVAEVYAWAFARQDPLGAGAIVVDPSSHDLH